jgi:hypothetical protein
MMLISPKNSKSKNRGKNINVNYLDLAKKLRNNKKIEINYSTNCIHTNNSSKAKEGGNVSNINKQPEINKLNAHARSTSTFGKSTKDSSFKMLNGSFKVKNEIDGPEDLHAFYVNILQQNKILAYKFENFPCEEDIPSNL